MLQFKSVCINGEAPFHLSRRGWGEFPLRVRIFFQSALNKPVDLIHNLKLDRTYTGRQTLGNETVIDLFLYDKLEQNLKNGDEMTNCVLSEESNKNCIFSSEGFDQNILPSKRNPKTRNTNGDTIIYSDEENFRGFAKEQLIYNPESTGEGGVDIDYNLVGSSIDHSYCFTKIEQEPTINESTLPSSSHSKGDCTPINNFIFDHCYCTNNGSTSKDAGSTQDLVNEECDLINGITENETQVVEEMVMEDLNVASKLCYMKRSTLGIQNLQQVITSSGRIISVKKRKKPQQSLLKKMFQKKVESEISSLHSNSNSSVDPILETVNPPINIDYAKYKVNCPADKFRCVTEALPFMLKRLPLISNLALDLDYKCTYPYAAKSLDEYASWNVGKQLSAEWSRAKTVLKIISTTKIEDYNLWNTKMVIMFARAHGYTPLANYKIFETRNNEDEVNGNACHSPKIDKQKIMMPKTVLKIEPELSINVTDPDVVGNSKDVKCKSKFVDHDVETACSYVRQEALEAGVLLQPEEIIPGVLFNGAERVLLESVLCLSENLVRNARANLVHQGNYQEESTEIQVNDIKKVLNERTDFNLLLKCIKIKNNKL